MDAATCRRALSATAADAFERGLDVARVRVLQDANRLVVRLEPCDAVAPVVVADRGRDGAAFEVAVAGSLQDVGCPVGVPDPRVARVIHLRDGFAISYWRYYEASSGAGAAQYARALRLLHAGMRRVDTPVPHFGERVAQAQVVVEDRSRSPDLTEADRELLGHALRSLTQAVVDRAVDEQLLHGEPHPGNVLSTADGVRFVDLETCCRGPVELDVAHAPEAVGDLYPAVDPRLLRDCRMLVLAMVAAWRADKDDDFPDGRAMRDRLVGTLRESLRQP